MLVPQKSAEKTKVVRNVRKPSAGEKSKILSGNLGANEEVTTSAPVRMYPITSAVCSKPIFQAEIDGYL